MISELLLLMGGEILSWEVGNFLDGLTEIESQIHQVVDSVGKSELDQVSRKIDLAKSYFSHNKIGKGKEELRQCVKLLESAASKTRGIWSIFALMNIGLIHDFLGDKIASKKYYEFSHQELCKLQRMIETRISDYADEYQDSLKILYQGQKYGGRLGILLCGAGFFFPPLMIASIPLTYGSFGTYLYLKNKLKSFKESLKVTGLKKEIFDALKSNEQESILSLSEIVSSVKVASLDMSLGELQNLLKAGTNKTILISDILQLESGETSKSIRKVELVNRGSWFSKVFKRQ